jgi:hypothetical protein
MTVAFVQTANVPPLVSLSLDVYYPRVPLSGAQMARGN